MQPHIYTIGLSIYPVDTFVEMLRQYKITAVGDFLSSPYSRYNPQFNRETLQAELKKNGIAYVYLSKKLGPRSDNPQRNGRSSDYEFPFYFSIKFIDRY